MYSQYCIDDLSLVSRMDPRMDIMQMPNSFIDKARNVRVYCIRRRET